VPRLYYKPALPPRQLIEALEKDLSVIMCWQIHRTGQSLLNLNSRLCSLGSVSAMHPAKERFNVAEVARGEFR